MGGRPRDKSDRLKRADEVVGMDVIPAVAAWGRTQAARAAGVAVRKMAMQTHQHQRIPLAGRAVRASRRRNYCKTENCNSFVLTDEEELMVISKKGQLIACRLRGFIYRAPRWCVSLWPGRRDKVASALHLNQRKLL